MVSVDRHALYQISAQNPEADLAFFDRVFAERNRPRPRTLREDFAGSAYLSCCFAASHPERTALAVDTDVSALAFCRAHNFSLGDGSLGDRVRLLEGGPHSEDGAAPSRFDVVAAPNFGLFLVPDRNALRRYLELTKQRLADGGLFIAEIVGGEESIKPLLEQREEDGFTYVWEQERFNPIDNTMVAHVHFLVEGGPELHQAFSYHWRVWTLAELREVLAEVGFSRSQVYWEDTGEDGCGTGTYHVTEEEEQQESWLAYLVAEP